MCAIVLSESAPLVDMMTTHFGCGSDLFMGRNYCRNLVKLIHGGAFLLATAPVMTNASIELKLGNRHVLRITQYFKVV